MSALVSKKKKKRNIGAVSQLAALVEKGGQRPCLLWHQNQLGGTKAAKTTVTLYPIQLGDECRSHKDKKVSFSNLLASGSDLC